MKKRSAVVSMFGLVLSLVYGIIAGGQILGFFRLYKPIVVIPLSIGLAVAIFYIYQRTSGEFSEAFDQSAQLPDRPWLSAAFFLGGLLLYSLLVFYPLVHWPYSPISQQLNWDAGLYHFPKAVEMVSTASAWDLSIAYGEYPFGYESLIAFSLLINQSGLLIGSVHALISLFLLLGMSLLIFRRTKLPHAPVFLLLSVLFLGYELARNFDSNIWWIFWPQITLIGKNDVLLAAALLAALVHVPSSREGPFFPFGLALASMIALSIKPNAALMVIFAWLVMLFFLWRGNQLAVYRAQLLWSIPVILPGGLWVVRNLMAQGAVFGAESLQISVWSIANNLANPYFYRYIPQHLWIVLAILSLAALVSLFKRSMRFDVAVAWMLLVTFALTPASAFFGSAEEPTQIAWRFALALLAAILLLLLLLFEPVILLGYRWIAGKRILSIPLALCVLIFAGGCIRWKADLLSTYPENEIVLHDPYREPVGVNGYRSAYEYVQKNVHNSAVIIENGMPFYLYDPGFTNTVTRSRSADAIVYIKAPWINEGGYPDFLGQPAWSQEWRLVYEDPEGRVYRRR